jgi:hypothetical protein
MVLASRWVPSIVQLQQDLVSLALMGAGALLLQQIADFAVGTMLRGISPSEQITHFATVPGLIYAGLLLLFLVMPILANFRLNVR